MRGPAAFAGTEWPVATNVVSHYFQYYRSLPARLPAENITKRILFFAPSGPNAATEKVGFRSGMVGTHTSRARMLAELSVALAAVPASGARQDYANSVVEANCLGKLTTSTRRLTLQRLSELYAFDPTAA